MVDTSDDKNRSSGRALQPPQKSAAEVIARVSLFGLLLDIFVL